MKNQRGFMPVIIILVVLIGFVGVYYLGTLKPNKIIESSTPTPEPTYEPGTEPEPVPLEVLTKDWKIYTNKIIKISLKYPSTLNGKTVQIFEPETNTNAIYLNTDKFGSLFFDLAVLPNTELEKWYQFAYSEAKQKTKLPPNLTDGPIISEIKSRRSTFYINGSGNSLVTFVQKGKDLYQISIPPIDNEIQELILSTIKFTN